MCFNQLALIFSNITKHRLILKQAVSSSPPHIHPYLPNLEDLSMHLHGATIFSKVDLEKEYSSGGCDGVKTTMITTKCGRPPAAS